MAAMAVGCLCAQEHTTAKLTDKVNAIIGTNGMGHTFPGACVPFGFVQLSPDTDNEPHNIDGVYNPKTYQYCAGYRYSDNTIVGFSHTHFSGTGHSDLGDVLLMPYVGETKYLPGTKENPDEGYRSRFNHNTEKTNPGYYGVHLDDYDVDVELTTTEHVGIHRYHYPKEKEQKLVLDLNHAIYNYDGKVLWANIRVENDTLLTGYRITNGWSRVNYIYFAISFSKALKHYSYKDLQKPNYMGFWRRFNLNEDFPEIGGRKIVMSMEFDNDDEPLVVKVALSAVSCAGAIANLKAETTNLSFDDLVRTADDKWEKALSVITAKGTDDQMSMLYASLYHIMINPSVYQDVTGSYRGIDHEVHKAENFTNHTIFSTWDTFRALHPLYNIILRKKNTDFVNSMLAHCDQSVHHMLPVWSHHGNENWCMTGYHSVPIVADAIVKGLPIDTAKALKCMVATSNVDYYDNNKIYRKLGYIPMEKSNTSVSTTLEYSYDDWTIYHLAELIGDKKLMSEYKSRALSFENVYKQDIGYACPKDKNGGWKTDFDMLSTINQGFIEGNGLNYSFFVPHDVDKLIELMGGEKSFVDKLDNLFTMHLPAEFFAETEDITEEGLLGGYVHGNEPSHHVVFLYNWTSQPWKTQYWQREIMNKMYRNNIDGLCGNDDCGQMSAWYVLSAMGFYPVCPGTNQYVLGAPYLPYMEIHLENGRTFTIEAPGVDDERRYVKSVKLNGENYSKGYITIEQILSGGRLFFEMSATPNKNRVFNGENRPYSMKTE